MSDAVQTAAERPTVNMVSLGSRDLIPWALM